MKKKGKKKEKKKGKEKTSDLIAGRGKIQTDGQR